MADFAAMNSAYDAWVDKANLPARATDTLAFVMNLDSNQTVPATAPFDPADVNTYNSTYTTKVFDSQGKEHTLTQYFVKTGANTWDAHYYQGNTAVGGPQALTFGTNGTLTAPVGPVNVGFALPGVDPMNIAIDYSNSSQYGSDFVVTSNRASGSSARTQSAPVRVWPLKCSDSNAGIECRTWASATKVRARSGR